MQAVEVNDLELYNTVEEYQDRKAESKKKVANKFTVQKDLFSKFQKQNKKFKYKTEKSILGIKV